MCFTASKAWKVSRRRCNLANISRSVSGRSRITRKDCTTSCSVITASKSCLSGSDIEYKCVLITAENCEPDHYRRNTTQQGHGRRLRRRQQAIVDAQTKAIEHVQHGI